MDTPYAFVARIEAKPDRADEVAALLTVALTLAEAEPGTVDWYAARTSPTTVWILDTFGSEDARQAHVNGEIAAARWRKQTSCSPAAGDQPADVRPGISGREGRKRLLRSAATPMPDNEAMSTVLVVDDEPVVRDVVVRYLEQAGYRTLQAADGDSARELLEQETPSLVVLDLMLPGGTDGLALCRWIRARSGLPVIMVTALGEEADRLAGLELGADDYLTKPFSPRELTARVNAVLRPRAAGRAKAERIEAGDLLIDTGRTRGARSAGRRSG